jgi:hypothetical protein
VTSATTEWFACFYFSYFLLLAAFIAPMLALERRASVAGGFARGMVLVYTVGQFVYTIVPGFGPYQHLSFANALPHGFWWDLVQRSVGTVDESTRTDIFPSLHTAAPLFLTLFAWQNRRLVPFRYLWLPMAFISSQIILATMFLRWHYLCDVLAGIALAIAGARFAARQPREDDARARAGLSPVLPPLTS